MGGGVAVIFVKIQSGGCGESGQLGGSLVPSPQHIGTSIILQCQLLYHDSTPRNCVKANFTITMGLGLFLLSSNQYKRKGLVFGSFFLVKHTGFSVGRKLLTCVTNRVCILVGNLLFLVQVILHSTGELMKTLWGTVAS
jgi:hypothetical protein